MSHSGDLVSNYVLSGTQEVLKFFEKQLHFLVWFGKVIALLEFGYPCVMRSA